MKKLDAPTQEELFDLWCDDLIDAGYITKVTKSKDLLNPIVLFEGLYQTKVRQKTLKSGKIQDVVSKNTLLNKITYKPDRVIFWAEKAKDVFFTVLENFQVCYFIAQLNPTTGEYFSAVEVKAPPGYGGANTSDASFRVKQKWVWAKAGVYINKVYNQPNKKVKSSKIYLWLSTFTPSRYFYTDKKLDLRVFSKFTPHTLKEFLADK